MNHLTNTELFDRADHLLAREREAEVELHLSMCAACRDRAGSLRTLERALRAVPLEVAPAGFADAVLERLGLRETPSWIYTLLKNIAPLVALTAVVVAAFAVLIPQGTDAAQGGAGESVRGLFQMASAYGSSGVQSFNAWVATYFSFARNSAGLMVFLAVFFAGIALVDRFLVMPMFRKRV